MATVNSTSPSLSQKKPNNTDTTTVETATQTITDDRSSGATTPVPSTTTSTATPSNFDPNYILPTPFNVADGFISFSDSFLYLSSIITPNLRDDTDVKSRIKKATAQVGALRSFFRHPHIDLETKMAVYTATALNTVLWLGMRVLDPYGLHQTLLPSIPSLQPTCPMAMKD
jgi:hypothetical protein